MTPLDSLDDGELLRQIATRDQHALAALYARHSQAVFNLASYVLRHRPTAEEVAQDVFILVWRHPDRWNPTRGTFSSWLLAVTRYLAIDRLRAESRHAHAYSVPLDELIERIDPAGAETPVDDFTLIKRFLNDLPADQKRVLFLVFFQELTHEAIARQLGIPPGTVKSRIRLALEKLRRRWQAEVEDFITENQQ